MRRSASALAAAALAVVLGAGPASAKLRIETMPSPLAGGRPVEVAAGQALVKFSSGTTGLAKTASLAGGGASVRSELSSVGWTVVDLPAGMSVAAGVALLRGLPNVEKAEPNHILRPIRTPNDPQVASQASLSQIDAFAGWEFEVGATNPVTIAFIDVGIDHTNSELAPKLVGTSQFFDPDNPVGVGGAQSPDNPPTPACNHATRTSGLAAAATDNGVGIAGLSWGANLLSLKVFNDADCNPTGDCPFTCITTDQAIINAIGYAVTQQPALGRLVINISLGGTGPCPGAMSTALNNAVAAGIPVAIASGNDGGPVWEPANCAGSVGNSGILPSGAVDQINGLASFSSRGAELAANGVVAPGVGVVTTDLGGGVTASATGTSFAAPHVAGLLALLRSAKPAASPSQLQAWVRGGAESIGRSPSEQGAGRINVFRSLRLAVNGSLAGFDGEEKAIAFPNPFRLAQTSLVSFAIPPALQGAHASIKIFTVAGQLVKELAGLTWDGRNEGGNFVASGTYIFLVKTGAGTTRGRLAVIR